MKRKKRYFPPYVWKQGGKEKRKEYKKVKLGIIVLNNEV